TGYTWNRDLFPDPKAFIAKLHQRNLKPALNLHPAEGIHDHEEPYAAMAKHMDIDPETKVPIPFSIADPHFTKAYFELLHHPQEVDGVDFWWMDWQQGTASGLVGLDPLWWLNHLHFYDLGRGGEKRPFIFSRWGGLGNHRYPIGFSGDTVVSWESLAFQPYFTATAANVNYGWWSHDIGGHMGGIEEPELYVRWVQYGVFSPILRLHCTNVAFHERRPWGYDAETDQLVSHAMRLRHAFIPYLYTMAWRNHTAHVPLIRAMYVENPHDEPAYHCPDQYWFGSELVAAPFISPADPDTRLSRQVVWLPKGDWFGFFDGLRHAGDGFQVVNGRLSDIPIFAKAGAIVPLAANANENGTVNPEHLEIHVFPGADNTFDLYEDDDLNAHSLTPIQQQWSQRSWTLAIGPAQGQLSHLPEKRSWIMHFHNVTSESVTVRQNDIVLGLLTDYDETTSTLQITVNDVKPTDSITITILTSDKNSQGQSLSKLNACQKCVQAFRMDTWVKDRLFKQLPAIVEHPSLLQEYGLLLTESQLRTLSEIIFEAGFLRTSTRSSENEMILMWNNHETENVTYRWHGYVDNLLQRTKFQQGPLPKFGVFEFGDESITYHKGNQTSAGRISVGGWLASVPERINPALIAGLNAIVQFEIDDETAHLIFDNGQATITNSAHLQPSVTITSQKADWLDLINGDLAPEELFLSGKLSISGDMNLLLQLVDVLQVTPQSLYRTGKWQLKVQYNDYLTINLD
ncbi:MAG: DUF5110 domain-containing protein, partial [Chloroflexi bacterium]